MRRLYEEVEKMGLYFPPHPGDEGAHVGGAVAANAGGARAVKYGTVRRFVLGLQVVLASGDILDLGGKYIKSSTGYHLADLMIGSEGTLGVITRVTLTLLPPVGSVQTVLAPFETIEAAIGAVPRVLRRGHPAVRGGVHRAPGDPPCRAAAQQDLADARRGGISHADPRRQGRRRTRSRRRRQSAPRSGKPGRSTFS